MFQQKRKRHTLNSITDGSESRHPTTTKLVRVLTADAGYRLNIITYWTE